MLHLTCGDLAGDSVRALLAEHEHHAQVRVLRDDLAVGPLIDVDRAPCAARAAFWAQVWPDEVTPRPAFASDLAADALWLAELSNHVQAVTVWHGDSASEQLLLARLAAALQGSSCTLYEVVCGTGDSSVRRRKAVSMHSPEALAALYRPQAVSASRQTELTAAWHQQCADPHVIRRWHDGIFRVKTIGKLMRRSSLPAPPISVRWRVQWPRSWAIAMVSSPPISFSTGALASWPLLGSWNYRAIP